jgi:hypothetical protein
MRYLTSLFAAGLLGCSGTPTEPPADVLAIQDYIAVAQLVEVDKIRTYSNSGHETLGNTRYIIFKTRRQDYLVEFDRDCRELIDNQRVTPDLRKDPYYLRPRMDTIRGCRIARAFELNEGQVEEIRSIGEAPTGG